MKKTIIIITAMLLCAANCFSQGTAINATGANADNSAILDISDTTKGILFPRMTETQKNNIVSPATGLIIFQTNGTNPGLWYYSGTSWVQPTSASMPTGSGTGDMLYWNGAAWIMVPIGQPGQILQISTTNIPVWSGPAFPVITTASATAITASVATSGGNVISDGGATVTARGVCWNTSPNPTTSNSKTSDGTGTGVFVSSITGLNQTTTYYVRAYATNSVGTVYGNEVSFTTSAAVLATLTTTAASSILATTASSGGNVTDDGGVTVTARGVCWSTYQNPTTADSKTTDGSGTGSFISSLTGLTQLTTYYVRAYAVNSVGTAYGNQISFTTISALTIGQSYLGGILAYLLQPGDPGYISGENHGLIAAPGDQGTAEWGCMGTTTGTTSTAIGSGQANTTAIVNICSTSGIAARLCDNLSLNGYNDWYLPSKDEIYQLYLNKALIGGFSDNNYWSSTEETFSNFFALNRYFGSGSQPFPSELKNNVFYVRAIRSF